MSVVDPLAEAELDRYAAGVKHGIRLMLEHKSIADLMLELYFLRIAYEVAAKDLGKARRTIEAYRTICRGG